MTDENQQTEQASTAQSGATAGNALVSSTTDDSSLRYSALSHAMDLARHVEDTAKKTAEAVLADAEKFYQFLKGKL